MPFDAANPPTVTGIPSGMIIAVKAPDTAESRLNALLAASWKAETPVRATAAILLKWAINFAVSNGLVWNMATANNIFRLLEVALSKGFNGNPVVPTTAKLAALAKHLAADTKAADREFLIEPKDLVSDNIFLAYHEAKKKFVYFFLNKDLFEDIKTAMADIDDIVGQEKGRNLGLKVVAHFMLTSTELEKAYNTAPTSHRLDKTGGVISKAKKNAPNPPSVVFSTGAALSQQMTGSRMTPRCIRAISRYCGAGTYLVKVLQTKAQLLSGNPTPVTKAYLERDLEYLRRKAAGYFYEEVIDLVRSLCGARNERELQTAFGCAIGHIEMLPVKQSYSICPHPVFCVDLLAAYENVQTDINWSAYANLTNRITSSTCQLPKNEKGLAGVKQVITMAESKTLYSPLEVIKAISGTDHTRTMMYPNKKVFATLSNYAIAGVVIKGGLKYATHFEDLGKLSGLHQHSFAGSVNLGHHTSIIQAPPTALRADQNVAHSIMSVKNLSLNTQKIDEIVKAHFKDNKGSQYTGLVSKRGYFNDIEDQSDDQKKAIAQKWGIVSVNLTAQPNP